MIEFGTTEHRDRGYLATPAYGGGPGVIVIQEWWGLVPHITEVCDRLAGSGFTALAPDLYHGLATTEPDEARRAAMSLDIEVAARDLGAAVGHLLDSAAVTSAKLGVVGFCLGGGLALYLASREPAIAACVTYYGLGPARDGLHLTAMPAAVLGHWAEHDHSYDRAAIEDLEQRLGGAGIGVRSFWYDADHAFFNDHRPEVYRKEAARLSWDRTIAFLGEHLRS